MKKRLETHQSVRLDGAREGDCRSDVVILAGAFGVEPAWTAGHPRPILPMPGGTLVEALLERLESVDSSSRTICANNFADDIRRHLEGDHSSTPRVEFHEDRIPRGTAGCVKDCQASFRSDVVLVCGASVWLEDDPASLIARHKEEGNALTVFCAPEPRLIRSTEHNIFRPVGVYCIDPKVLEHIPTTGYFDIKEQLVPALRKAGLRVGAATVNPHTREVTNWPSYMAAVARSIEHGKSLTNTHRHLAGDIWCGEGVSVAKRARIVGPAVIGAGSTIDEDALIIGPAVLGAGCHVGAEARLLRVVLPNDTSIANRTRMQDCLYDNRRATPVTARRRGWTDSVSTTGTAPADDAQRVAGKSVAVRVCTVAACVTGLFIWSFWHTCEKLWNVWQTNDDYSAGQLVPIAIVFMIASRFRHLAQLRPSPSLIGLGVFMIGLAVNLAGLHFLYSSLEFLGLILAAQGIVIGILGVSFVRDLRFPLLFMLLMLPLPIRVHEAIMLPLQAFGAQLSAAGLEIVGIPVARYGHILEVGGHRVAVAEACNGLRMALAFLIVTGVVAYVVDRARWQKTVVLLSCIPIALACNIIRIMITAYLYSAGLSWLAEGAFHDGAGLLMMPLSMALVWLELWILSRISETRGAMLPTLDWLGRKSTA